MRCGSGVVVHVCMCECVRRRRRGGNHMLSTCWKSGFWDDNWASLVEHLRFSPQVKINMFNMFSPPVLRFAQDNSPVAFGAPHAASLRCLQVKLNTIPLRMPANEMSNGGWTLWVAETYTAKMLARLNKAFLPLHAGKLSSSATDLSERATIHWALFLFFNDLIFYCVFHLQVVYCF